MVPSATVVWRRLPSKDEEKRRKRKKKADA